MASFSKDVFNPQWAEGEDHNKVRTVGLELELLVSNKRCPFNRETIQKNTTDGRSLNRYFKAQKLDHLFPGIGYDGTDLEFTTHPDSISFYQNGGSPRFKTAIRYLKRYTSGGRKADNSGTHVNISKLPNENTEYTLDNAYWICMNFGLQLQKIAGRVTHWAEFSPYYGQTRYTRTSPVEHTSKMTSRKPQSMLRAKQGVNKSTMLVDKSNVYEFRIFKASNNIDELLAWVELCYNIINLGSGEKPIEQITFQDIIQGSYIRQYAINLKGVRKLTDEDMEATIQNTLSFQSYCTGGTIIL